MSAGASPSINFEYASVSQLADFYATDQNSWVRSNMVISLDGHYVDENQTSENLSSDLDLKVLLLLRALSDVIIVGGRTARQENYKPKPCREEFRSVARPQTRVAVITRNLDFDLANVLFHGDSKPILLTTESAYANADAAYRANLTQVADIVTTQKISGAWAINQLREFGLHKVVSEGGPFVQNLLREDNVLNEMDVTIAPLVMGSRMSGSPFGITQSEMKVHSFAQGADNLFVRYFL